MKKILLSAIMIMGCISGYAQEFRLGLKAHPTFGYLTSDDAGFESDGVKIGFSYGLLIDYGFADNYAFATELSITGCGGSYKFKFGDTTYASSLFLQYVEIPLTLKLRTNAMGDVKYYGQFGLAAGVNVKAKNTLTKSTNGTAHSTGQENVIDDINLLRLALVIGAGAEYTISGNTALTGGITFNNGFTDIASDNNSKITNSYFALNLGVLF